MPSLPNAPGVPLLKAKLCIPPPRPALVARPRLIEQLDAALERKLTLVSSVAGSGKTTLLSQWAVTSSRSVAWISLDEGDNDPTRFLTYVVASLQMLEPGLGQGVLAGLQSPQAGSQEAILTALVNEMAVLPEPIVLVLDDYHLIRARPIHGILRFLLEHLPPAVHLILSTQADPPLPLSRLRAHAEVAEIRIGDLRFSAEEVVEFLNRCLGLGLPASQVGILEARTEGWIVGLQLAGLSLQKQPAADRHAFVTAFAGDDRYVADYLVEEVMRRQSESIQGFLLETSILDRLSASLCSAVTGLEESQVLLEELERANLFLVPMDAKRVWYRYHHLFSDLLRQRLRQSRPDRVAVLHRRASDWFELHGFAVEAVNHALAAEDFDSAACLIEATTWTRLSLGEISTLLSWLEALPEELVRSRPRLGLIHAWALIGNTQLLAIERRLRDVERCLPRKGAGGPGELSGVAAEVKEMLGEVAAIRATVASMRGDVAAAIRLSQEALARLPGDELRLRGIVANTLGTAYDARGEVEAAMQAFTEAAELSQAAGNTLIALIALGNLARAEQARGQLGRSGQTCQRALQFAAEHGGAISPAVGVAHLGLGMLFCEWNDLGAATRHLAEGIRLGRKAGIPELVVAGDIVLARVEQARGEAGSALEAIQEAEQLVRRYEVSAGLVAQVAASRARLLALQGNLAAAEQWIQESGPGADGELDHLRHAEYVAQARVLIALGRPAEAETLLTRLLRTAEAQQRLGHAIELFVLRALSLGAQGEPGPAMTMLEKALVMAEPLGYVRTFADEGAPMAELLHQAAARRIAPEYIRRLLDAFGEPADAGITMKPGRASVPALVEPLTDRELEVLRLIAAGLSNREIAQELVVTVGTAKWHVNNIYGKLDVHSRTQALGRARSLGLL